LLHRRRCRRCSRHHLENRGGTCGRKAPVWQAAAEAAIGQSETPGRALLRARALQSYQDPARPYIHLFDGGLSENLSLTEVLRAFELLKVDPDERCCRGYAGPVKWWSSP